MTEQQTQLRNLVADDAWQQLPEPVRRRFGERFQPGRTTCYRGHIINAQFSWLGRMLAQVSRLIGAPLPLHDDRGFATVTVTDHPGNHGQVWTRLYHARIGMPQVVQSVKRLRGPTGLEEYMGAGLAIALRLSVDDGALVFSGSEYYWRIAGLELKLPAWLSPEVVVRNWQSGEQAFHFSLQVTHPYFGELISHHVAFDDRATSTALVEADPGVAAGTVPG